VHPLTPTLAREVRDARSLDEQIDVLHGRYAGERCVIVTCGPSLGDVDAVGLRAVLRDTLTIVVKQGVDVVGDQTDFHCWNSFNVAKFGRPTDDTIRCFVAEPTGRIIQHNRYDVRFPMVAAHGDLTTSLAARHDFGDHLLTDTPIRPFGPGIVYELCIYLALHLGVVEIITVGWDIANTTGKNTHFYDRPDDEQFFESERARTAVAAHSPEPIGAPAARKRVPEPLRARVRWVRTRVAHERGRTYNRTRVLPGETELVAASTEPLARWLTHEGVKLSVTTQSPFLAADIPRLTPDDLFDHLATSG
jgi:hypothetical protein